MCSFSLSFSILDTFSFSPDSDSLLVVCVASPEFPEVVSSLTSGSLSLCVLSTTPVTRSALLNTDLMLSPRERPEVDLYVRSASLSALGFVVALVLASAVEDPISTGAAAGVAACWAFADVCPANGASCLPRELLAGESSVLASVSERFCVAPALASPAPRASDAVPALVPDVRPETGLGSCESSEGEMLGLSPKPARPGVWGPSVPETVVPARLVEASVLESVSARFLVSLTPASPWPMEPWPSVAPESVVLLDASCEVTAEVCAAVEALAAVAELKASEVGMVGFAERSGMAALLSRADFSRMGREVVFVASAVGGER